MMMIKDKHKTDEYMLKFPSYKESHSIHPKHILALCEGLISPSKDKHKNADDQKISKRMMNI